MNAPINVIVVTGSMGTGKTTVMAEASDLLREAGILHAAIDLDALAVGHLADDAWKDITYRNLESLWKNYANAGATRLLIAEAVESRAELEQIRDAIPHSQITVCRLTAKLATMEQRVKAREPGMLQAQSVERAAILNAILDVASLEEFAIENDSGSVTEVARAMLVRAGWL